MSRTARLRVADAATDAGDEPGISAALDRVVQLFARGGDEWPEAAGEAPSEIEMSATIALVRSVAGRVRTLNEQAHAVVAEQRRIAQAAQARADEAEARERAAAAEVERVARQMRELAAKLTAAETRAAQAEIRAGEAQLWLRRLHDCMSNEFTTLTIAPL